MYFGVPGTYQVLWGKPKVSGTYQVLWETKSAWYIPGTFIFSQIFDRIVVLIRDTGYFQVRSKPKVCGTCLVRTRYFGETKSAWYVPGTLGNQKCLVRTRYFGKPKVPGTYQVLSFFPKNREIFDQIVVLIRDTGYLQVR